MGRGVRRAADAGAAQAPARPRWPGRPRPRARGRAAGRVRRDAAVRADRRPARRSARRSPPTWRRPHPMHRLLQGEVGSGKTLVRAARDAAGGRRRRAGRAARAHRGAGRPALPQHQRAARARWAGPASWTATRTARRSRWSPARSARRPGGRRWPRSRTARAGIVVGTHALLYEGVDFDDLGLVVVDEQHRFGVEQRDALRAKAGAAAARAGDDRDADPAHGRDDRLRRPGDVHADAAAARPLADRLARGAGAGEAGLPGPGLAAGARGGPGRATRRTWCARGSARRRGGGRRGAAAGRPSPPAGHRSR